MYEEQIKLISVDDLKRRMNLKDKPLLILDAREIAAFDQGHIPGASDIYDPELTALAKDFDENMGICVYGPGPVKETPSMIDRMAGDAAKRFMNMGYKNVRVLDGGFEAWEKAGNRVDVSQRKKG
ncbi:rhodanese-like domain-containing protein [Methanocella sp. MCL-LM]|uniref:rhodanese-like domain-containing protein n=1 Tax=Methanocella sp. MCL-LM TaxID=3412035 RepID=UPI003C751FFA